MPSVSLESILQDSVSGANTAMRDAQELATQLMGNTTLLRQTNALEEAAAKKRRAAQDAKNKEAAKVLPAGEAPETPILGGKEFQQQVASMDFDTLLDTADSVVSQLFQV